jgi:Tn7-like transposition protein D
VSTEYIARRLGVDFKMVILQGKRLALPSRSVTRKRSAKSSIDREKRAENRKEWLRLIEMHVQEGITALIRRSKGARTIYNWLNKHDRKWLLLHRPPKKMPQRTKEHIRAAFHVMKETSNKSRREERDVLTSQAIRLTAHQIKNAPGEPRKVTRVQLEKSAPSAGWLLSRPKDFPLTAQAFQEVRETREAFALRRVQWVLQRYQEESTRPTRKELISRAKVKKALDIPSVLDAIEAALTTLARK